MCGTRRFCLALEWLILAFGVVGVGFFGGGLLGVLGIFVFVFVFDALGRLGVRISLFCLFLGMCSLF